MIGSPQIAMCLRSFAALCVLAVCSTGTVVAQPEPFDSFLYAFCSQPQMRTERTVWPLPYTYVDHAGDGEEKTETLSQDSESRLWALEYDDCYDGYTTRQVFDTFEMELRDTGRRVVSFSGNENSTDYALFFERRQEMWYLVRVVNKSF